MSERDFPTTSCPKCGKSMGLSHQCGLDRNVTLGELRKDDEYINERVAEFRPHAKGCTCNRCLQAIIDQQAEQLSYQAKEIKAKNKVFKYLRDNVGRDNVLSIQDIKRMCKKALKDGA